MIRRPVSTPPVKETRSTPGSSDSGAPTSGPAPSTRLATPAGSPASSSARISRIDGRRRQLAGLEDERVAGQQGRSDLPRRLQQRVVPRRDQAAHADRLVHHPADGVGDDRCRSPGRRRCRPRRRSSGSRPPRRRCRTRSRPAACRCPATRRGRTRPGRGPSGRPCAASSCAPLPLGGAGPGAVVERPAGGDDRLHGVGPRALRHHRDDGTVCGTTDLAAAPVHGIEPLTVHVELSQRLHPSGRNAENPCCRCSWRIEMLLVQQNGRVARRLSTLWTQVGTVADRWMDAGVRTARTPAADLLTGAARSPTLLRITQRVVHDASRRPHGPSSRARPRVHPHVVVPRHPRPRLRREQLPRAAVGQHPREPAVRRPADRPLLHAGAVQPGRQRRVAGARGLRPGRRRLPDVLAGARRGHPHAHPPAGVAVRPLPQRPALPRQHRRAQRRDPRGRVQPP